MNAISTGIQKLEHYADAIVNLLTLHNNHLEKIASPESPSKLSRFNVVSEAQLHRASFQKGILSKVFNSVQGQYVKINHWAYAASAKASVQLYIGEDGATSTQQLTIIDCLTNEKKSDAANPNELVIPPGYSIYALSEGEGESGLITISTTSYELTL